VFRYDPHDPVPTVGGPTYLPGAAVGANAGPRDRRAIERRSDVLTYTTAPLQEPIEVTGPVTLTVHMSTSAADTDITGALVDLHPDGRAELLTEGILRARYRHSLSAPEPLEPDRIHELHVDLWATSNVFGAGHRIRLEVSSSNFPRFDRNPNTGGVIATTGPDDLITAVTTIHHDRHHPSHVTLPIIARR
jgi:putative CocE/NonD family hydrolase